MTKKIYRVRNWEEYNKGVQVIGEGEWKKLHIAIDADSHEILAATMTESVRLDGNYLPELIDKIDGPIAQITGIANK